MYSLAKFRLRCSSGVADADSAGMVDVSGNVNSSVRNSFCEGRRPRQNRTSETLEPLRVASVSIPAKRSVGVNLRVCLAVLRYSSRLAPGRCLRKGGQS